jgi:glucose 1-dehydrogenase
MGHKRKTAIVTGASRGIGRGIALALAERGYDLFITHLNEKAEAEAVARTITDVHGRRCEVMQGDLSLEPIPQETVERAVQAYGHVDALVNNAGVTLLEKITELNVEKMNYLMQLNYRAPMLMIRHAARHMIEQGIKGGIVSITSSRAERAYPLDSVYGGMKAALVRSIQSIALELAPHGIRVNTVGPGAIEVREDAQAFYEQLGGKIPLGRTGLPSDIGSAVAWLLSEEASYITGVNLRVDGGLILPGMPERSDTSGWGQV